MPAYLVAVFECHSREEAEAAAESADLSGHAFASVATEIHDTPPVVLSGLVRGGEVSADKDSWSHSRPRTCGAPSRCARFLRSRSGATGPGADARGGMPHGGTDES